MVIVSPFHSRHQAVERRLVPTTMPSHGEHGLSSPATTITPSRQKLTLTQAFASLAGDDF